jgi:hypothetical protein
MPIRRTVAASLAVALLSLGAGGAPGDLTASDLTFGSFLAAAPNTVNRTTVEVSSFIDGLGHAGTQFSSPLAITNGGGSKEIVADVLFTVTEATSASTLRDLTQAFTADVLGSGISAFDFTRAGPMHGALSNLAANCINGDVAGCPQIAEPST